MSKPTPPSAIEIEKLVRSALEEDFGEGDITTEGILRNFLLASANATANQNLTLCGENFLTEVFRQIHPQVNLSLFYTDGDIVTSESTLFALEGDARSILKGERTALNIIQHLSGIATLTKAFSKAAYPVKILDTRKTHPSLRKLEKYAVACGGGKNHRFGLYDAVLIKDNHIKAAGGIAQAIRRIRESIGYNSFVEIETTSLEEVREAVAESPSRILLDNMSTEAIRKAVEIVAGRSEIEVSGSVTLERAKELSKTGIDFISVGAVTHSAPWVDISLNFIEI